VAQLQAAFTVNWGKTTGEKLLGEDYFPTIEATGTVVAKCSLSGPGEGPERVEQDYVKAISAARASIDIGNAYFIPDDRARSALVEARQRGVRIRIVVPAVNDSRFGRAASRSRWGPLLAAGAEFYLYGVAMYHAKTMAVDDTWVTIGSANFDHRSFRLNDEVLANFIDPAVGAAHRQMFEHDLEGSRRLTWEEFHGRPWYLKLADYFAGLFRWFL
jgi:cardiolipin synthase A/B